MAAGLGDVHMVDAAQRSEARPLLAGVVRKEARGQKRSSPDLGSEGDTKRLAAASPITYCILCPNSRIGSVIGKGGEVIKSLRHDTGAKVKVEDGVFGCEERIIHISSPENPMAACCPAQDALFRIHSLLQEGQHKDGEPAHDRASAEIRLLVDASQIGCILGKGGSIITEMRRTTGASIRVLGPIERPPCAADTDELVQISGAPERVQDALTRLSKTMREHPPKPHHSQARRVSIVASSCGMPGIGGLPHPLLQLRSGLRSDLGMALSATMGSPLLHGAPNALPPHLMAGDLVDISFRMLVPAALVGRLIGRSGEIIRRLRHETGTSIKIHNNAAPSVKDDGDRVVEVGAGEERCGVASPAAEALICLALTLLEGDAGHSPAAFRLLVPKPQIGAVLGKGGTIITALRQESGATLKVCALAETPGMKTVPPAAAADDECIGIEGAPQACLAAIRGAAALLRWWQVRNAGRGSNSPRNGSPGTSGSPMTSPDGSPSGTGPRPRRDASGQSGPVNGRPLAARRPPPARNVMALPPHLMHGGLGPKYSSRGEPLGPSRLFCRGVGSPSRDVVLRLHIKGPQVGCIVGKGGSSIAQIRQISGARVKLAGPRPDWPGREMEIIGTHDQAMAAQNLIQGFLLAGGAPPLCDGGPELGLL